MMNRNKSKFLDLLEKKKKLLEQETKLIDARKQMIGNLASRFELLTTSDALIAGVFLEAQKAIQQNSEKMQDWESLGARFLRPQKQRLKKIKADNQPATTD